MFSVSRLDLQNMGFPHEQVASLTDEDMQQIAEMIRQSYDYLEDNFAYSVAFATTFCLTKRDQPVVGRPNLELIENPGAVICDMCNTWVATYTVTAHNITYNVCDKPRCQEDAYASLGEPDETR